LCNISELKHAANVELSITAVKYRYDARLH